MNWMSTSQRQSPRLKQTFITEVHHFTWAMDSNEGKGFVQSVQQLKKPIYLGSNLEFRASPLSCHFSLKCLNSFKYSAHYL